MIIYTMNVARIDGMEESSLLGKWETVFVIHRMLGRCLSNLVLDTVIEKLS